MSHYLIEMPEDYGNAPEITVKVRGAKLAFNKFQTDAEADDYPKHAVELDAEQARGLEAYGLTVKEIGADEAALHMSTPQIRSMAFGLGVYEHPMDRDEMIAAIKKKLQPKKPAKKAAGGDK